MTTFYKIPILLEVNDNLAEGDEAEMLEESILIMIENYNLAGTKVRMGATERLALSDVVS